MTYEIYTFGGGELLWKVFNGLALLLETESKYITPLLGFTATIGALWAGVRGIFGFNTGVFAKDFFLPFFLILNIFLVPKASVIIIDKVDTSQGVSKVDNIPFGLAVVASTASVMSYEITKALEKELTPVELPEKLRYTNSGPMFAAHLVARARDIRVVDPLARRNLKNFVRQCYTWPYIFTNIAPGTEAAAKSTDILKFIEGNPHPGLGIYWHESGGDAKFLNCKDCLPKIKELMKTEQPKSLISTLGGLFRNKKTMEFGEGEEADATAVSKKLKTYMDGGWHFIAQGSADVHRAVDQQMLINAYREGLDDLREKHGHRRAHPRLISHSATRYAEQQNTGYLVQGALAARYLPSIQTTIFAILLLTFFFVIPMAMLPGGMGILGTWIKLIFWVQSWPVFFTILNYIGLMWLEQSTREVLMSNGSGLNILTQNGLSDAAYDSYAFVQGLFWAVPLLSWAILNKGGYALVSMAERFAPSGGAMAGASIVDNTQSFDTQAFHNRSIGSYQMAQQQMSPSISTGEVLDDGRFRRETDVSGNQIFTEKLANLKNNVSLTEGLEGQLSQAASHERQAMEGKQVALNEAKNEALSTSAELTQAIGSGKVLNKNFSESENKSVQETIDKARSFDKISTNQNALSDSSSWNHSGRFSLGAAFKRIGVNLSTGGSWSAEDRALYEHLKRSGVTDREMMNVSKTYAAVENKQASFTDDQSHRLADSYRGSHDKVQSLNESISASQSKIDRLSAVGQHIQREGLSFATNINDDVLKYTAHKRFGGNMDVAARWQSAHGAEFRQDAKEYTSGFGERLVNYTGSLSQENLSNIYGGYKQSVMDSSTIGEGSIQEVKDAGSNVGLDQDHRTKVEVETSAMQTSLHGQVHDPGLREKGRRLENSKDKIRTERVAIEKKYKDEKARTLFGRATYRKD